MLLLNKVEVYFMCIHSPGPHREKRSKNNVRDEKITFLLGAGASFGHISNQAKTPLIMNKFLSSSVKDCVLTEDEFPELAQHLQQSAPDENLFQACQSIESSSNLEDFLGKVNDLWVLHLGLFYIYRYLGLANK